MGRGASAAERKDQAGRRRQDPPRHPVHGQGLLRPLRGARETRHRRHLSLARRAALSVPNQGAGVRVGALQAGGDGVVPGGAAQHGLLVLRRRVPAMDPQPDRRQASQPSLCRASGLRIDRGRADAEAPRAAQAIAGRGVEVRRILCARELKRLNMADIRVPTLGESVTEATVGKWFKQPGDAVAVDEPLVELETDKVTLEVPAPAAGVLGEITAKNGETVAIGALLGQIMEGASAAPKAATPTPKPAEAPKPAPAAKPADMPI